MNQQGPMIVKEFYANPDPAPVSVPSYFQNHDLIRNLDSKKTIKQRRLINLWNRIHFMDEMVRVRIRHPRYQEELLVEAYPVPCGEKSMSCIWPESSRHVVEGARILDIILTDGLTMFLIPSKFLNIQHDRFTIMLPEKAYILGKRKARHFNCCGIQATLVQDGFQAQGQLIDFSSRAFTIRVSPEGAGSFRWFNSDSTSIVNFFRHGRMVFSASCGCIRQTADQNIREIVLAPKTNHLRRFLKKKWRSPRISIRPMPSITFEHPLIRKNVQLDMKNLSTSGFAVDLEVDEDVLMVGMIIPQLTMNFSGAMQIPCKAQVLYRRAAGKHLIRYSFAILDMEVVAYNRLSHILMNIVDPGVHVAEAVDSDRLWEFLFDSGFIYPKKYTSVQANRKAMKDVYQRLYRDNPEFIAQLTYQRNGRIYGHASMVRAYSRTWMVHHLAARPLDKKRTGMQVLKNIMHYFSGFYRMPSIGMDYLMFYFRPENRFPDHFFGGFARQFRNPRACSLEMFSYFNYPTCNERKPLPGEWTLGDCEHKDIEELNRFYRHSSNGLLLTALGLDKEGGEESDLSALYARHGFLRTCRFLSLKRHGRLKAVFIVNRSNVGLNLSDFLNGIKLIITDAAGLSWPILSAAISQVADVYRTDRIPILIYPSEYCKAQNVSLPEKKYNLWILDVHYAREYSEYMMENIKFRIKFILKFLINKFKGA